MQGCLARRTGTRCLGVSTSRLCIGWPRGDAQGSFRSYSHAKRGASPLRLPACRAGQQCVSPPNCRPGPRSSRSGQCFPKPNKAPRPRRPAATRALMLLFPLVATAASPIWEPGRSGWSAASSSASATMPPRLPGRGLRWCSPCRAWPGLLFCCWLTIKHHIQARVEENSIIWPSASYSHRHSHQVQPTRTAHADRSARVDKSQ